MVPGLPIPTLYSAELPGLYSAFQATYHSISSKNLSGSGMLLRVLKKKEKKEKEIMETNTRELFNSLCG